MPARFTMNFHTGRTNNVPIYTKSTSAPAINVASKSALNSSMIGRVYNAKPGCSACGKKVA